jgi:fatty acyl-CoA reductase
MKFSTDPIFHPILPHEKWIEKTIQDETPLDADTIPQFFKGREIFITGGTGFIGKVLIEKLLRSCPEIEKIYLLMRARKGQSIHERVASITNSMLFDALRKKNPKFLEKLVPIDGDITKLGLGISKSDLELMKNVSIIFHSAASVRFDDSMKYAILMNTRGTREVMTFAESLKSIKCVMHVSTTYSNVYLHTIEEKVYPPMADWQKTIEICEKLDEDMIDMMTDHYTNFMPNTYVHSKNLAEHVSMSYMHKLPLILFRPSIVVASIDDPFGGYVDNLNGPMGILMASCAGVSKTMYCDPKNIMDQSPVDIVVKAMIISAWKRAHEPS